MEYSKFFLTYRVCVPWMSIMQRTLVVSCWKSINIQISF